VDTVASLTISLAVGEGRSRLVTIAPPAGPPKRAEFPVPLSGTPQRGAVDADVLYTEATSGPERPTRWHVKVYRCTAPELARTLAEQFAEQGRHIARANARVGPFPLEPPWAMAPVFVARADAVRHDFPGNTDMRAGTEEIRALAAGQIPGWFGPDAPPQPDACVLVLTPAMQAATWWDEERRVKIEQLAEFRGVAAGLDVLHEAGMAHCDVKVGNLCRIEYHSGYVLIDSDAVTPLSIAPRVDRLRMTEAPAPLRAKIEGGAELDRHDLLELDRYGFVVAVAMALTTRSWLNHAVLDHLGDDEQVRAALRVRLGPSYHRIADLLAEALVVGALRTERWSAAAWLASLEATTRSPGRFPPPDPTLVMRHHADIEAVRNAIPHSATPRQVAGALWKLTEERGVLVQQRAWARAASLGLAADVADPTLGADAWWARTRARSLDPVPDARPKDKHIQALVEQWAGTRSPTPAMVQAADAHLSRYFAEVDDSGTRGGHQVGTRLLAVAVLVVVVLAAIVLGVIALT
jgi:hypothetical protein